ncbi:MAG: hypothetical protein CMB77_03640 [Euryarchaeota archaeon]|nr:hypothetical protein [Euryarchaeota archaeon]|tara:strand:- start:1281 stop:1466 length:186 start_codon:yes stop_codon:yes gene_type:complete
MTNGSMCLPDTPIIEEKASSDFMPAVIYADPNEVRALEAANTQVELDSGVKADVQVFMVKR